MASPEPAPRPLRASVLRALGDHGLAPAPATSTELLRTQVRDLYLFEIRRLRHQVRRGTFPMSEYASRVVALRHRYPLLSLPLPQWHEPGAIEPLR